MKRSVIALLALLFLAPSALAADRLPGHFGEMDEDGDGHVTWQELKSYVPLARKDEFSATDRNGDGRIDRNEWQANKTKFGLARPVSKEPKDIKDKDMKAAKAAPAQPSSQMPARSAAQTATGEGKVAAQPKTSAPASPATQTAPKSPAEAGKTKTQP